jgi:hypothetical protein
MAASLTEFGIIALPLIIGITLLKRRWLLPALVVASTLQAPSVLNIDFEQSGMRYGVTAFSLVAIAIVLSLMPRLKQLYAHRDWLCGHAGRNLKLWLAYAGVALVGAALLPVIFGNTPVYLLIGKASFEAGPIPLRWTLSNLAQAANLVLLVGMLIYIRLHHGDRHLFRRMFTGLAIALVLSALVGLQQRLAWHQILPMMGDFWASNPAYAQNFISYAGPVARVSWPFTEPAYGSAWYAAMFGGCMVVFFAGKRSQLALLGMLIAAFALINSLGATGIMAIGMFGLVGVLLWVIAFVKHPQLRWTLGYQSVLAALVLACCSLAVYIVLRHNGSLPKAQAALANLLVGNNPTVWGDIRQQTNLHAFAILRETFGLGVGLGSNRASSYFASLFSNTGGLGGVMFLVALSHLIFTLAQMQTNIKTNDTALFLLGALCTATIAVAIAIPDQNWPVYWVFILTSYACISQSLHDVPPVYPNGATTAEPETAQSNGKAIGKSR